LLYPWGIAAGRSTATAPSAQCVHCSALGFSTALAALVTAEAQLLPLALIPPAEAPLLLLHLLLLHLLAPLP
jgi:hypothetical protein